MILSSSHLCAQMLRHLAEPALRALALAALAGLALAVGRVKDAELRLAVWTALLYVALAMPFLAWVAPAVRLPMPALPAAPSVPPPAPAGIRILATGSPLRVRRGNAVRPASLRRALREPLGFFLAARRRRPLPADRRCLAGAARAGLFYQPARKALWPSARRPAGAGSAARAIHTLGPRNGARTRRIPGRRRARDAGRVASDHSASHCVVRLE